MVAKGGGKGGSGGSDGGVGVERMGGTLFILWLAHHRADSKGKLLQEPVLYWTADISHELPKEHIESDKAAKVLCTFSSFPISLCIIFSIVSSQIIDFFIKTHFFRIQLSVYFCETIVFARVVIEFGYKIIISLKKIKLIKFNFWIFNYLVLKISKIVFLYRIV